MIEFFNYDDLPEAEAIKVKTILAHSAGFELPGSSKVPPITAELKRDDGDQEVATACAPTASKKAAQLRPHNTPTAMNGTTQGTAGVTSPATKVIDIAQYMEAMTDPIANGGDWAELTELEDQCLESVMQKELVNTPTPATETPKPATPATEAPKPVTPVAEAPKPATPAGEAPKPATPATEAPKPATPVAEAPKPDAPVAEAPKPDAPVAEAPKPATPAVGSSWAGLFRNSQPKPSPQVSVAQPRVTTPVVSPSVRVSDRPASTPQNAGATSSTPGQADSAASGTKKPYNIGAVLSDITINHSLLSLQPRGLVNRGNWCYVNATLQALIACPPFANLLKSIQSEPHFIMDENMPILNSLLELYKEFSRIPLPKPKSRQDLRVVDPIHPQCVLNMLKATQQTFQLGKQEDAEEFLTFMLNGLHEEMVAVMQKKTDKDGEESDVNGGPFVVTNGTHDEDAGETEEDIEWKQVDRKKKPIVTRKIEVTQSPISQIFGGMLRSTVSQPGGPSATLERFFTIQLDILSPTVSSVPEALLSCMSRETLDGFTCTKTKQQVEANRWLQFEELPLVLVLHLKYFSYDKSSGGGLQKSRKQIHFSESLKLDSKLVSGRRTMNPAHLSYKLFAVVCHKGAHPTTGHYTTRAYHSGPVGWLYYNDGSANTIPLTKVFRYEPEEVPYLLFYRREYANH